jgi:hypothetical protein
MKIFGPIIRYSPEETARARMNLIGIGCTLREVAKTRAYIVTTEYDLFEKYRITHGFPGTVRMYLTLGFRYLFNRLKYGKISSHTPHLQETCRRPGQKE